MRDVVYPAVRQRRDRSLRRTIIMHISSATLGFLLMRAPVFSGFLPFGTAFCAGVSRDYTPSALLGVILGSFFSANSVPAMIYIGAAVVAVALKWALMLPLENEQLIAMISAAVGTVFSGICALLGYEFTVDSVIRTAGEALLATGTAYFLSIAIPLLGAARRAAKLTPTELCAALVGIATALVALSPCVFFGLSASRIFAFTLILFAARYGRETAGAVCGIVFGFTMSIAYGDTMYVVGAYALGGLLGGVFSRMGGALSAVCALLGVGIMSIGCIGSANTAAVMAESLIALALYALGPKKLHAFMAEFFAPAPQLNRVDGLRHNIVMRMRFASDALTDVSNTVDEVAERLSKLNMPTIYDVFIQTEKAACSSCGLRIHCYETLKAKTYESFLEMTRTMRKNGGLSPEDYPEKWVSRCLSPDRVAEELTKQFLIYESRTAAEMRISQIRSAVSDQMSGLSDMLYDLSEEMNVSERYDTVTAGYIDNALRKEGILPSDVCCKLNASGRMSVEICVPQSSALSISKLGLLKTANHVCARNFSAPAIVNAGSKQLISMVEKPIFSVDIGVAQQCCRDEKLCGDSYAYFADGGGRAIMILSDGMGSGGRAAVDSTMAARLMSRLIKAGFGFECSLKLLNSAMMFKSRDDSLATVDITSVDLFSGQSDFYKAGSPDTIVIKGKKTGRASCESCPAGIVRDISFDKTTAVLDDGDVIIMMSDGVCGADGDADGADDGASGDWIEKIVRSSKKMSAQSVAELICDSAARRRNDGHEDDITVMVGRIKKASG